MSPNLDPSSLFVPPPLVRSPKLGSNNNHMSLTDSLHPLEDYLLHQVPLPRGLVAVLFLIPICMVFWCIHTSRDHVIVVVVDYKNIYFGHKNLNTKGGLNLRELCDVLASNREPFMKKRVVVSTMAFLINPYLKIFKDNRSVVWADPPALPLTLIDLHSVSKLVTVQSRTTVKVATPIAQTVALSHVPHLFLSSLLNRYDAVLEKDESTVDDRCHFEMMKTLSMKGSRRTLVLATGDGNENKGLFNFVNMVEFAIKMGWKVRR